MSVSRIVGLDNERSHCRPSDHRVDACCLVSVIYNLSLVLPCCLVDIQVMYVESRESASSVVDDEGVRLSHLHRARSMHMIVTRTAR
jgi:hypothetical protein